MARIRLQIGEDAPREAGMFAPKNAGEITAWYRAAQKALPAIPEPGEDGWILSNVLATIGWVVFELHNIHDQHSCTVLIDRKSNNMGR